MYLVGVTITGSKLNGDLLEDLAVELEHILVISNLNKEAAQVETNKFIEQLKEKNSANRFLAAFFVVDRPRNTYVHPEVKRVKKSNLAPDGDFNKLLFKLKMPMGELHG